VRQHGRRRTVGCRPASGHRVERPGPQGGRIRIEAENELRAPLVDARSQPVGEAAQT